MLLSTLYYLNIIMKLGMVFIHGANLNEYSHENLFEKG